MIIENPQKIKKAEILVGITSYNEAQNIGLVAQHASLGLEKYFSNKTSAIINTDNNSDDNTKEAFFNSAGQIPKIYISTDKGFLGKGYNVYNFLLMMQKMEAKAGIILEADLKSISPQWIEKMAKPIFEGYQFLAPYYIRFENEATITNHIVYPLIYGIFGLDLRQPLAGDFSFSGSMADWWLKQQWPKSAYGAGIDVFLSLHPLLIDSVKSGQVNLGSKIHRASKISGLNIIFNQIVETLFKIILANKHLIKDKTQVKQVEIIGDKRLSSLADLTPDYKSFKEAFFKKFEFIAEAVKGLVSKEVYKEIKALQQGDKLLMDNDLWVKLVYDFLTAYDATDQDISIIETLKCFYFGRVASFFEETTHYSPVQSENAIIEQAECFFENRNYFLTRQEKINAL